MLKKGDVAVYGNHGLCRISDIMVPSFIERGKEKLYYMMVSVTDKNGVLYVPVEGAEDKMREVVSSDEAESLIEDIEDITETDIPFGKKSESAIFEVIKRNIVEEMMGLVKSLVRIRSAREVAGKKFSSMDEKYLGMAEKLLFTEMAYAMDTDIQNVQDRVAESLSGLQCETV